MQPRRFVYVLLCSAVMSVFFVPTIFFADIISWKTNIWEFAYLGFMAILYGVMLIGRSKVEFVCKWALSLPLSYLIINWFWKTDFAVRSLNWVFPGYGRSSAGGGFAGTVLMFYFLAFCAIALVGALLINKFISVKKTEKAALFEKIQLGAGAVLAVFIVIITLSLERRFPSLDEIFRG